MQLYTFVGSSNGRKAEAVINHLGIKVEIRHLDVFAGDLRRPDYLALNPNARVPTLVDGAFTLWESDAIVQYLADRAGAEDLFPREPKARAEVVRWQFWNAAHFNRAISTLAFEAVAKPAFNLGPTNAAAVEIARTDLAQFAPVLEAHLEGRDHMVGKGITLADYATIKLEPYQMKIPFDWTPFPRVNAYFERMRRVEAWAKTAPKDYSLVGRKPKAVAAA